MKCVVFDGIILFMIKIHTMHRLHNRHDPGAVDKNTGVTSNAIGKYKDKGSDTVKRTLIGIVGSNITCGKTSK